MNTNKETEDKNLLCKAGYIDEYVKARFGTNEPKIELPEPPEGHRWEYRGKGWDNGGKKTSYCHTTHCSGVARGIGDSPCGVEDYHYWEAVAALKTDENPHTAVAAQIKDDYTKNLERENAELREWKRQQLQVWSDLNLQEVGDELELAVGTPIAENVLPGIKRLKGRDELQRARIEVLENQIALIKGNIAKIYNAI
jgi:hypothetical protein